MVRPTGNSHLAQKRGDKSTARVRITFLLIASPFRCMEMREQVTKKIATLAIKMEGAAQNISEEEKPGTPCSLLKLLIHLSALYAYKDKTCRRPVSPISHALQVSMSASCPCHVRTNWSGGSSP